MAFGNPNRAFINITGGALFWLFMMALLGCGTYIYMKTPPDPLSRALWMTREERKLRQIQDPLAMRLYIISDTSWGTDVSVKKEVTELVVKQWEKELGELKEKAYHMKAADWDIKQLPLDDAIKAKLEDARKIVPVDGVKPGW